MSCRNVVTPPPGPSITPGDSMAQGGGTGEGKAEHSSIWDYGYGLILGVSTVRQPALQVNLPCGHQQCSKYLSAETVNPFSIIFNPALVFPDSLTGSDQDFPCIQTCSIQVWARVCCPGHEQMLLMQGTGINMLNTTQISNGTSANISR